MFFHRLGKGRRSRIEPVLALLLGFAGLALPTVMPGGSVAQATNTTLTAYKTAKGFFERTKKYDWTIEKSVYPESIEIKPGETKSVEYQIEVTRVPKATKDVYGVRGKICVKNTGSHPTKYLAISDTVQTKIGSGSWQNYVTKTVNISAKPVLQPGQSYCYPYSISFTPVKYAQYKNKARITIKNYVGHAGTPYGVSAYAPFWLPTTPVISEKDKAAQLTDKAYCPIGFTCTPSDVGPWWYWNSGVKIFTTSITNNDAPCNSVFRYPNTAKLKEKDSGEIRTDYAEVVITTGECEPVPPVGCTYTQGYWKTHGPVPTGNNEYTWPQSVKDNGLTLGSVSYTAQQLLSILNEEPASNGLIILAHQLIAAKLNVANGASAPASVITAINDADAFIGTKVIPPVGSDTADPNETSDLTDILDEYNNGNSEDGPPHCEDEEEEVPIG